MSTPTAATPDTTLTGDYKIDPTHTRIGFSARHAMVSKVRGQFNEYDASVFLDTDNPANSHVEITIKAASIDTHNPDRDAHLRSNDFLAMDEYPDITFRSTSVEKDGQDHYKVNGDLEIRGVSKPLTLDFDFTGSQVDPWGNLRVGFEGGATINRKDWGVNWNAVLDGGGVMVSDRITLEFDLEAVKVVA
jgi:polyisoprenoid-binding protein YceI